MQKRKNRRKTGWILCCLGAVAIGIGLVSLYMAGNVLAAPEDPAAEAVMRAFKEQEEASGGKETEVSPEDGQTQPAEEHTSQVQTQPAGPEKPAGPLLIMVDPGHGGLDEGCSWNEVTEKQINLEIALLLKEKLEEKGYRVRLAREDDTYLAKEDRAVQANRDRADAYISIHQNTWEDSAIEGIETWYDGSNPSRDSRRLARLVHRYTVKKTGALDREAKEDPQLYVTRSTEMPSCLIETGFLSNQKERGLLETEEYREKIAEGIAEGVDLFFHPKTMYLTFDDGPSAENTVEVLDILKEKNVKATFFVVGESVRKHPEVARRIVAEGHTIGIHCNNHAYETVYESADSYIKDFEEADKAVREVTGVEAVFFRFPGGSINSYNKAVREEIIEKMTEKGYVYFDWNASLEDAVKNPDPQKLIENGVQTTLGRKKVVMLAHDVVHSTALCLEQLLDAFPEYEMRPLTEGVEPVQFHEKAEGLGS